MVSSVTSRLPMRLIVGLGSFGEERLRVSVGLRVTDALIRNCGPSPRDIHDPSKGPCARARARNEEGYNRQSRVQWAGDGSRMWRPWRHATWDTRPFEDYGGRWCDRLLLGDPPVRCAVLQPIAAIDDAAPSIKLVLQAHPQLCAHDVLVVSATPLLPFGSIRLSSVLPPIMKDKPWCEILACVAHRQGEVRVGPAFCWIGVGQDEGVRCPFAAKEWETVRQRLSPLGAFGCALWACNPVRAVEYLASEPQSNPRLWATMQQAMLSTRDEAVLDAVDEARPLAKGVSLRRTQYYADRIHEKQAAQRRSAGKPKSW